MAGRLAGRLVLISGASAGIGRATALRFIAEGARVIGLARNGRALEDLAVSCGGPAQFVSIVADVADGPAMEQATARVLREIGIPEIVVANAGVGLDALFVETTDVALEHVLAVNVVGVARTLRPFVRPLLERGSGRLLVVSSIVGKRGIPHYSAYSASKFALHGMCDALRVELAGSGVTVGIVCPSSTESEFQERIERIGPPQRRKRLRRHSADSVARAIVEMALSRRAERVLSLEAKLMVFADSIWPALVDRLLARTLVSGR